MNKVQKIVADIQALTLLEFHEFVTAFNIPADVAMKFIALRAPTLKVRCRVINPGSGTPLKLQAIKVVRDSLGWNLKDAKDFVDGVIEPFGLTSNQIIDLNECLLKTGYHVIWV